MYIYIKNRQKMDKNRRKFSKKTIEKLMLLMLPLTPEHCERHKKKAVGRCSFSLLKDIFRMYDTPATKTEAPPTWTPEQELKRRKWAQVLCSGALNETSVRLARRLCKSWFPNCRCGQHEEEVREI